MSQETVHEYVVTIFNILPSDLSFIHFFPRVSEKFIVPFRTISITASNALVDNLSVGLIKFHADFLELQENKKIRMDIPVKIIGDSPGVQQGGKILIRIRKMCYR